MYGVVLVLTYLVAAATCQYPIRQSSGGLYPPPRNQLLQGQPQGEHYTGQQQLQISQPQNGYHDGSQQPSQSQGGYYPAGQQQYQTANFDQSGASVLNSLAPLLYAVQKPLPVRRLTEAEQEMQRQRRLQQDLRQQLQDELQQQREMSQLEMDLQRDQREYMVEQRQLQRELRRELVQHTRGQIQDQRQQNRELLQKSRQGLLGNTRFL